MEERRHSFDSESVSVLHKETDWFKQGVAEAIHIFCDLNRERERHTLPKIYMELLLPPPATKSRDHSTSDDHVQGSYGRVAPILLKVNV